MQLTRTSDAVIVGCGRIGTLNEFTIAFEDNKPIGVLEGDWPTDELIKKILDESHRGNGKVVYDKDPKKLVEKVIDLVNKEKSPDNQMPRLYIKGIGMMAGLIIGAGVFALPYAFSQAGVFWGTVHLAVSLFIVYLLHQWYGEVSFLHQREAPVCRICGNVSGQKSQIFQHAYDHRRLLWLLACLRHYGRNFF